MTRTWRDHEVVAAERDDGTFALLFDGEDLGAHKGLTRTAEVALAREGVTSGVNGFAWFKVGTPVRAPRTRKGPSVEALAKEVERLQVRSDKAAQRAAQADLGAARKSLAEARAATDRA